MPVAELLLVSSVALATLIAVSTAHARTACANKSHEVRAGNQVIGCDPDAFTRGQILREWYSGWRL
jgi:hypothetical protein